jgi:CRP/FNR family transcriptional regulator, cyclic AMP receptor protein
LFASSLRVCDTLTPQECQCIAGRTATALTDCALMRIEKPVMLRMLQAEPAFLALFVSYLLSRNVRIEEDLIDHLFNSSEKRLARVLLLLAHFGKEGKTEPVIPGISQETLAEMIGTTRSRLSTKLVPVVLAFPLSHQEESCLLG